MFENAKQYNAEGSDVYMDAEELQVRFSTYSNSQVLVVQAF